MKKKVARLYVDGFNMYHGALKQHGDLKWLNLEVLFDSLLPDYDIEYILYGTAPPIATTQDPDKPNRHNTYIAALRSLDRVEVIQGVYKARCKNAQFINYSDIEPLTFGHCVRLKTVDLTSHLTSNTLVVNGRIKHQRIPLLHKSDTVTVRTAHYEEKQTDVSIGARIVLDTMREDPFACVIVSNDSDLMEPLRIAKEIGGLEIVQINPRISNSAANPYPVFTKLADRTVNGINKLLLKNSQFPNSVHTESGTIFRPKNWH